MFEAGLIQRLPTVRGSYTPNQPLGPLVWFRVGGAAEVLFKPKDVEDLSDFLKGCPADVPLTFLGVGSNVLIRDGGIPGVVIRLMGAFSAITVSGTTLVAGAGALDRTTALTAASHGLSGLEFLIGVPGTVGGAVCMNAGAYGQETKDVLVRAQLMDRRGNLMERTAQELDFSYRHAELGDAVVLSATFALQPDNKEAITRRMEDIMVKREAAQPVKSRTGGSTFKNPEGGNAWKLIDAAGFRGRRKGDAQISEQHCNFLINVGQATAQDLEDLAEEARIEVCIKTGVTLEWEIKRLGIARVSNV